MATPLRQIRASFTHETVRVYQAYSEHIALPAVQAQTFVAPFKRERMTWVKPSFTWMMYRSGWASKPGQERVLGIDLHRHGFEEALAQACLARFEGEEHASPEAWQELLASSPVRIQWDPERTLTLEALPWRSLQVGIGGDAVDAYVTRWIARIEDVTERVHAIHALVERGRLTEAEALSPVETPYPLGEALRRRIGASSPDSEYRGA